jgi:hypothetical protein
MEPHHIHKIIVLLGRVMTSTEDNVFLVMFLRDKMNRNSCNGGRLDYIIADYDVMVYL